MSSIHNANSQRVVQGLEQIQDSNTQQSAIPEIVQSILVDLEDTQQNVQQVLTSVRVALEQRQDVSETLQKVNSLSEAIQDTSDVHISMQGDTYTFDEKICLDRSFVEHYSKESGEKLPARRDKVELPQDAKMVIAYLKNNPSPQHIEGIIADLSGPPAQVREFLLQIQEIVNAKLGPKDPLKEKLAAMISKVDKASGGARLHRVVFSRKSFSYEVGPIPTGPGYQANRQAVQLVLHKDLLQEARCKQFKFCRSEGIEDKVDTFIGNMDIRSPKARKQLHEILERLEEMQKAKSSDAEGIKKAIAKVRYYKTAAKLYDDMKFEYGKDVVDELFSIGKLDHQFKTPSSDPIKAVELECKRAFLEKQFGKELVTRHLLKKGAIEAFPKRSKEDLVLMFNDLILDGMKGDKELLKAAMQDCYTPAERAKLAQGKLAINKDKLSAKFEELRVIKEFMEGNANLVKKGSLKASDYLAFKRQLDVHVKNLNEKFFARLEVKITPKEVLEAAKTMCGGKKEVFSTWLKGDKLSSDYADSFFVAVIRETGKTHPRLKSFDSERLSQKGPRQIETMGDLLAEFDEYALGHRFHSFNGFLKEVSEPPFREMGARTMMESIRKEPGGEAVVGKLLRGEELSREDEVLVFHAIVHARQDKIQSADILLGRIEGKTFYEYIQEVNTGILSMLGNRIDKKALLSCIYSKEDVEKINEDRKQLRSDVLNQCMSDLHNNNTPPPFHGTMPLRKQHIEEVFPGKTDLTPQQFMKFQMAVFHTGGLALLAKFNREQLSREEYPKVLEKVKADPYLEELVRPSKKAPNAKASDIIIANDATIQNKRMSKQLMQKHINEVRDYLKEGTQVTEEILLEAVNELSLEHQGVEGRFEFDILEPGEYRNLAECIGNIIKRNSTRYEDYEDA